MVQKFLPNYRKWFDYEETGAVCPVLLQRRTLGEPPGLFVYKGEKTLMKKTDLTRRIQAAAGTATADIVIKNARIIDVFNREIAEGDVAITDGTIVGIGNYEGKETIDAEGKWLCPSFIDGHVHIESSMVPPSEFAKMVLPHGVTTVITDPHEIGNVSGVEGIQFMLDDSENLPLDALTMLPSCVPATPFENSGAELGADDLAPLFEHDRVIGLAEVMDYPSLRSASPGLIDKIALTSEYSRLVDGHLAGLPEEAINVYRAAGVSTDHECNTVEDAKARLQRGMYLLIREGSVAKDLKKLLPVVNERNVRRCLFCTDDKHLDDLVEEGSIDHNIRLAIGEGMDPLMAIQMATLNAAECYGLYTKGAIAPGFDADFLLLDDLDALHIASVYKGGRLVARNGSALSFSGPTTTAPTSLTDTLHFPDVEAADLSIQMEGANTANVIQIIPNQLQTIKRVEVVDTSRGTFSVSIEDDQLKMAVVERHHSTGNIGLGIVKGFGLKAGAIATTVAHDSHNLVAVGTNDSDLLAAIRALRDMKGGLVMVKDGSVIASLSLEIGGLMSSAGHVEVLKGLEELNTSLKDIGFTGDFNPFLTLSFLTLPVIPSIKLTDLGLFDVDEMKHIPVRAEG